MQKHKSIFGKILYTSRKAGRAGQERGREWFTFTTHRDGKRSVRAICEIDEPDPTVLRDVTYSLDENDHPMDCFVRLTVGDEFMGSGFFIVHDDNIECESYGPSIGRLSQKFPLNGKFDGFGFHPIAGDAYITKKIDRSCGPHRRSLRTFVPSPDHRGASPPMVAEVELLVEYVGEETVTVKAGTFDCCRYRFCGDDDAHPPYEVWVTADDDAVFVQGGVDGYMMTWYELVELERR